MIIKGNYGPDTGKNSVCVKENLLLPLGQNTESKSNIIKYIYEHMVGWPI